MPDSFKIFILGSGRSGTHWLGDILKRHPDITVTVEQPPIFPWVTRMATHPESRRELMDRLLRKYEQQHQAVAPKHYADKSHPAIWIAEDLARAFSEARFIGMCRSPYGTVASMLRHKGVMSWIHKWRELPIPNAFLGLDENTATIYEQMPLAARCALRWKSHQVKLMQLEAILKNRVLVLDYEGLHEDTKNQLSRIQTFLELSDPIPSPKIKRSSIYRWRTDLTDADIAAIDEIVTANDQMEWVTSHDGQPNLDSRPLRRTCH